ncbi:hypothetical protein CPLU01_12268 [Colletotrichum plurivorum]|uniref:Uncharacterized protein n=1 Tax=Colletotrichum plurivorum TaxID=2175906 RepID=A0A8H6K0B5_9PEZI|nr:hypothetical protein CPLU01_12268 [Colletotrichum plurivorum]
MPNLWMWMGVDDKPDWHLVHLPGCGWVAEQTGGSGIDSSSPAATSSRSVPVYYQTSIEIPSPARVLVSKSGTTSAPSTNTTTRAQTRRSTSTTDGNAETPSTAPGKPRFHSVFPPGGNCVVGSVITGNQASRRKMDGVQPRMQQHGNATTTRRRWTGRRWLATLRCHVRKGTPGVVIPFSVTRAVAATAMGWDWTRHENGCWQYRIA